MGVPSPLLAASVHGAQISAADMEAWVKSFKEPMFEKYAKLALERIVRYRPHTLSAHEEQILAMSGQMSDASNEIFRQLNDTDLKWPVIEDEKGMKTELGHSSFSKFLQSPKRGVRKEAFHVYYGNYEGHKHTVAASLNASVQRDVFYSKVRGYPSARESSLFHDNVPVAVYDSLIEAVHKHLPTNHRYLALRKRALTGMGATNRTLLNP